MKNEKYKSDKYKLKSSSQNKSKPKSIGKWRRGVKIGNLETFRYIYYNYTLGLNLQKVRHGAPHPIPRVLKE